ncbi:hypothetical protein [Mucilaginibacter terrae]|nr:hypothetical protein [Mucilaginibacter terrae]
MKLILPALVAVLFASCSSKHKTDLENQGIRGNVSKIIVSNYDASEKFGEVQKGRLKSTDVQDVNEDGNNFKNTYTSFYDHADDTIPGIKRTNDVFVSTSRFNDKKQRIAELNDKNQIITKFIYNDEGKVSVINNFNDGKLSSKAKYSFADGKLTGLKEYNADGGLNENVKYTTDESGWVTEEQRFTTDNELKSKLTFSIKDKLVMGYKRYIGNKLDETYEFKYPKFDDHKNWIVQYRYRNNEIEGITERKLIYK